MATRAEFTRRSLLAGGGALILAGCAPLANQVADHPKPLPLPNGDVEPTTRLVHRTTFGHRPGDIARVAELGREAFVDQQLEAKQPEELRLMLQLERLDAIRSDDVELTDIPKGRVIEQLQAAAILRAAYGRNQLHERMVDFWSNHFNVYSLKGDTAFRKGNDEQGVVRKHALGNFVDMVQASAHSPAMLAFLDNDRNISGHPNENYARELLELHTLGVEGGYSQKDVQEVARCFSGWTLETRFLRPKGHLRFDPEKHDDGAKQVLGHVIAPGGGQADGMQVLDIVTQHPATAHHVARKLVKHLLGTEDAHWIARTEKTYLESKGSIPAMIRPLLLSRELLDSPPILRRPFDLMVAAIRAVDANSDAGPALQKHLLNMGEAIYQWPMPDGYPSKTAAWSGSMLARWNFAHDFAHGKIAGTGWNPSDLPLFETVFGRRPGKADQAVSHLISNRFDAESLAACLAAPAFQWS